MQILGLAPLGEAEWSHLRHGQHSRQRERGLIRWLVQVVALGLAITLMSGRVPPLLLTAWSVAALLAIAYAAHRDRELGRIRHRPLVRGDFIRHAVGLAACGVVWALPLIGPDHTEGPSLHLGLWTLAAMVTTVLALTTRAAPLSTVLFAAITGPAGVAGFLLHGELALASASVVFSSVALFGTIESTRAQVAARLAQAGLADKEELVSLLLREFEENAADWLWQVDTDRRVRAVSPRFAHALGQAPEAVEGRPFLELAAGARWEEGAFPASLHELADQLKRRQSFSDLLVQIDVDGQERWWKLSGAPLIDEDGRFAGFRGVGSDVTSRHLAEQKIAYLARHDALTGLPNRSIVIETLQESLRAIDRRGGRCSLLLIDLDRFKAVNDTLGHPIGDKLLVQVAGRLQNAVGQRGVCGRLGGDEFAIVVPEADMADVDGIARAVIEHLSRPFDIDGHRLSIGASVGSADGPQDGAAVEVLMRHADLALYRAKRGGRGVHQRYQAEAPKDGEQQVGLRRSLPHAIERQEFQLAFQPMVEAGAERLSGFEALLRWESDDHGPVGPERCIPLAEANRMSMPVGEWVLQEACRQAARWPGELTVAVNLFAAQLREPGFAAKVVCALENSGLPPRRLELEVTESMLLPDPEAAHATVQELRQLGCAIAIDDFGTGTSSLGQLRRLNFPGVKLDRSIVRGAARREASDLAVVRAVMAMAECTGLAVTAEGVEMAEEARLMRQLGCARLQGFYYGRPMTASEALALVCRRPSEVLAEEAAPPAGPSGRFAAA